MSVVKTQFLIGAAARAEKGRNREEYLSLHSCRM